MDHLTALKNEQTARIVMRDTALYVYIGTIFAAYAAEGQAGANEALVELIRACATALSAIMFSIYLSNDFYVSRIGSFVRDHSDAGKFSEWEHYHRRGLSYWLQKVFRSLIVLLLFGGWAAYESIPVFLDGGELTRMIAAVFGAIVAVELLLFLRLLMGTPKPRQKTGLAATGRDAAAAPS